jgi:hypothetical protein
VLLGKGVGLVAWLLNLSARYSFFLEKGIVAGVFANAPLVCKMAKANAGAYGKPNANMDFAAACAWKTQP